MARYCFYCGRELTAGEKCSCRCGGASEKTADSTQDCGQAKSSHASSDGPQTPHGSRASSHATDGEKARQPRAPRQSSQSFRQFNWRHVKAGLAGLGRYLVAPADSISRAAAGSDRQPLIFVLLAKGLVGGLFFLITIRRTILRAVIVIPGVDSISFTASLYYFLLGFAMTIASSFLITLLYFMLLRFLYRQPAGFRRLMESLCPSFFYVGVFMIFALLVAGTTVFNAAMLLLAGFSVSVLTQFMAMRQIMAQDVNRCFSAVVLVQILYTGILAVVLNLSLPMLQALLEYSSVI